jgi:hypothetical protein
MWFVVVLLSNLHLSCVRAGSVFTSYEFPKLRSYMITCETSWGEWAKPESLEAQVQMFTPRGGRMSAHVEHVTLITLAEHTSKGRLWVGKSRALRSTTCENEASKLGVEA